MWQWIVHMVLISMIAVIVVVVIIVVIIVAVVVRAIAAIAIQRGRRNARQTNATAVGMMTDKRRGGSSITRTRHVLDNGTVGKGETKVTPRNSVRRKKHRDM